MLLTVVVVVYINTTKSNFKFIFLLQSNFQTAWILDTHKHGNKEKQLINIFVNL